MIMFGEISIGSIFKFSKKNPQQNLIFFYENCELPLHSVQKLITVFHKKSIFFFISIFHTKIEGVSLA